MEACIARGGISHVLSQARASLKNPSRPYTPRTTARPLFHGEDYRPGSRPSSSYTLTEQKELQRAHMEPTTAATINTSSDTALPPRPDSRKNKSKPESQDICASLPPGSMNTSSSQLKLMHAPIIADDDIKDVNASTSNDDSDDEMESHMDGPLEASLEIPSTDQLCQSYAAIEQCIRRLSSQTDHDGAASVSACLSTLVNEFLQSNSFFLSCSSNDRRTKSIEEPNSVAQSRLQLFNDIAKVLTEQWSHSAECVLTLTPCLLDLYGTDSGSKDEASTMLIIQLGKVLFILSKESVNDARFCDVHYVEAALNVISSITRSQHRHSVKTSLQRVEESQNIVRIDQVKLTYPLKLLIYIAGTLKNISNAVEKMLKLLATNRSIAILSDTTLWRSVNPSQSKEIAQFLIQTTGVLRNLSVVKSYHKQFLEARVPSRLCTIVFPFIKHQELMVNVSRILSKLTLHELPRAQINQDVANLRSLVALINCDENPALSFTEQQPSETRFQDPLLIRVFFVLGNLCAGNGRNRQVVAFDCSGISVLISALQFYAGRYSKQRQMSPNELAKSKNNGQEDDIREDEGQQTVEVLVKLVRVLANLAINADIAEKLNEREEMELLLDVLKRSQELEDEELMLNIVSCITNVSYFNAASTEVEMSKSEVKPSRAYNFIERNRLVIVSLLSQILVDRNEEAVVEATRAFGNLTRFKDVLTYMGKNKVLDCFVVLLDHSNREIVYTVCGVLMNAALDEWTRRLLLEVRITGMNNEYEDHGDIQSMLINIVECAAMDDVEMTCIACKVLYNLLLAKSTRTSFAEDENANSKCGRIDTSQEAYLCRVIRQIMQSMEQTEIQAHQKRSGRETGHNSDVDNFEDDSKDCNDQSSCRNELWLVLPQLLRSVGST